MQEFSAEGKFIRKWGSAGIGNGQFSSPSGVAVSANGSDVYVVDKDNDRVQEYDPPAVPGGGKGHNPKGRR